MRRTLSVAVTWLILCAPCVAQTLGTITGEVKDPWAVRFFDAKGGEISYFVWDSLDWHTARHGRPEWGGQYALLQHHPGNDPKVLGARDEKIAWAKKFWPDIGQKLEEQTAGAMK